MLMHVSVLYIVSISRHVCVCMCVCVCVYLCNIHTYMHTRMISFLFIMLRKFVNKIYIISHDMRNNMVSETGGGADQEKKNWSHYLKFVKAYQLLRATDGAGVAVESIPQPHAIFSTPVFGVKRHHVIRDRGEFAQCLAQRYWLELPTLFFIYFW